MRTSMFYMFALVVFYSTQTTASVEQCGSSICISGVISASDASIIEQYVDGLLKKKRYAQPIVVLNSTGGDVQAAIRIGRKLRRVHAIASIGSQGKCYSACVFILAGATDRVVNGNVGIHRPFSMDTSSRSYSEAQEEYRRNASIVKRYLFDMNISNSLYDAMIRVPPERIKILSDSEMSQFGLNQDDPVEEEISDSYSARKYGLTKMEYLARKQEVKQTCENLPYYGDADRYKRDYMICVNNIMAR